MCLGLGRTSLGRWGVRGLLRDRLQCHDPSWLVFVGFLFGFVVLLGGFSHVQAQESLFQVVLLFDTLLLSVLFLVHVVGDGFFPA